MAEFDYRFKNVMWVLTFSQPSGGSRARKRFIRGDAPVAPSSGDVL